MMQRRGFLATVVAIVAAPWSKLQTPMSVVRGGIPPYGSPYPGFITLNEWNRILTEFEEWKQRNEPMS